MLETISLKNLKSLRNVTVKLKPITILLGKNSSGKSSFLQSLLLIKQTMESRDTKTPIVPRGNHVDLGSFPDIVFGHDSNKTFSINLTFSPQKTENLTKESNNMKIYKTLISFYSKRGQRFMTRYWGFRIKTDIRLNIEYSFNLLERRIDLEGLKFYLKHENPLFTVDKIKSNPVLYNITYFKKTSKRNVNLIFKDVKIKKFYLPNLYFDVKKPEIKVINGPKYKTYRREMAENAAMRINSIAQEVEKELNFFSENLIHIDPIREIPKRTYVHSGEKKENVGPKGEATVDILYADKSIEEQKESWNRQNEKVVKPQIEKSEMINNVIRWLKTLDMASSFDFPGLYGYAYLFRLKHPSLRNAQGNHIESSIADHGFGLSQVLPIIVQGYYSPPGTFLLLEQPEIHLHPKAQADLAEMIVEISKRDVNCIVETHSEHIVERLQLLVAKDPSLLEKISILLFQIRQDGTEITELKLSESGKRVKWPEDFVDGFLNGGLHDAIELEKINMLKRKKNYQKRREES